MIYTVTQAKKNFSCLLKNACAGKEVIISRYGKAIVQIIGLEPRTKKRVLGGYEHLYSATDDAAFAPLTDQELKDLGFE